MHDETRSGELTGDEEHPDEEALALLVEGEADAALRARIARHVDSCPSCLQLLAQLGRDEDASTAEISEAPAISRLMRDAALFAPSKELDRFVLLEAIGRGAMGTVYAAYDRQLDRKVAIKLLHAHALVDPDARAQLLREARALGKISHPHVVPVHEVGEVGERLYVVMEHVQGRTLRAWMRERTRPWREVVEVFVQAGMGLSAAHAAGVVHRDFKPENVLIGDDARVRVVDFGLARAASRAQPQTAPMPGNARSTATCHEQSTGTGTVAGTPAYMAPEQWRGAALDGRTDQYGFCVALYEALHGERPFVAATTEALRELVLAGRMQPPPKRARVPARLRRVLLRGLSRAPEERWPSMDALLEALLRLSAPRRGWWLALGLGLGAVGVVVGQSLGASERCEGARSQLEGIWDEPREAAVKAAILDTALPYAADTWERVDGLLDAYADAWATKHTEVCEATSVRREQSSEVMDLRMACLRSRRIALREAVSVLAEASASQAAKVEKAVSLVSSLPGLERCDDVEALRAELPPPEEPEVAARVR
jgi:tRNA A-37 threonylcarbamoyl transferase component Bud32